MKQILESYFGSLQVDHWLEVRVCVCSVSGYHLWFCMTTDKLVTLHAAEAWMQVGISWSFEAAHGSKSNSTNVMACCSIMASATLHNDSPAAGTLSIYGTISWSEAAADSGSRSAQAAQDRPAHASRFSSWFTSETGIQKNEQNAWRFSNKHNSKQICMIPKTS